MHTKPRPRVLPRQPSSPRPLSYSERVRACPPSSATSSRASSLPPSFSPHLGPVSPAPPASLSVLCLIAPWLRMNRQLQIDQAATLSRDHLLKYAATVSREAQIISVPAKARRSKSSLAEFIIGIIRHSLLSIQHASCFSKPHRVLLRLRLTPESRTLSDPVLLECYLLDLLGISLFSAFTEVNDDHSAADRSKRIRYTKRKARTTVKLPVPTLPPLHRPSAAPAPSPLPPVTDWPRVVPRATVMNCCRKYYEGTKWTVPTTCAVCARARSKAKMHVHLIPSDADVWPAFHPLRIPKTSRLYNSPPFSSTHPLLNNVMLSQRGLTERVDGWEVNVCDQCNTPLMKATPSLPKFALRNNLYLGVLPDEFADLTWVEEQVCALYRSTAFITRLYGSDDPRQPYIFRGNTCAFAQNTVSTAKALPRTPADVSDLLSVVFTGSSDKVSAACLKAVFRVRKMKIQAFLEFLSRENELYKGIVCSEANLDMYPDDGSLPGVEDCIIMNLVTDPNRTFDSESASFEPHPATQLLNGHAQASEANPHIFLESTGVFDADGVNIPARSLTSSAVSNLIPKKNSKEPDLIIHRAELPASEYGNPKLFPGMFPTLFPFGIGGFDDDTRSEPIGFRVQAEYFLDLADHNFRAHRAFIFHCLNVHQRRLSHVHTALTVRRGRFDAIAPILASLDPKLIESVAKHIENEGKIGSLTREQQKVMTLLNEVNTVSAKIPGTSGAKLQLRNEIRSYMGYFGLPHLYLTLNPAAGHSPIFQVMWGDEHVDLSTRFPELAPSHERAIRLTSDPVAGADFFDFAIEQFFRNLLGWDFEKGRSSAEGGIFGRIRAYYGTAEFTERGQLHGHFLIWLDGGLNPADVHARMRAEPEWQQQFFDFFEDIIKHHLPETDDEAQPDRELRAERPPHPDNDDFDKEFVSDVKLLGDQLQRHVDRDVCFKYGSKECRFGFPHEVVEESSFDEKDNAIILKCIDPLVNYHNPYILAFCRHNHDLKCILSGKSAKAAMFYISDYITKNDEKMHQVLTMLCSAVAAAPPAGSETPAAQRARTLLHKCLSARVRAQNIHAQQAARYLRGLNDGMNTHSTIPMLSSAVVTVLAKSFAHIVCLNDDIAPHTAAKNDTDDEDEVDMREENSKDADSGRDDAEVAEIRIRLDDNGKLYECNQVDDFLHRDAALATVNFYDFVRCYRKCKKGGRIPETGRLRRFELREPHPEAGSHMLIEFADPCTDRPGVEKVPRVIGRSIPRRSKDESYYATFMLAHFRPFSYTDPITLVERDIVKTFDTTHFSDQSLKIMKNWDAIHECEDEREAERLKKQSTKQKEAKERVGKIKSMLPADYLDNPDAYELSEYDFSRDKIDNETLHMRCALLNANWTHVQSTEDDAAGSISMNPPDNLQPVGELSPQLASWKAQIKQQSAVAGNARRAQLDPTRQTMAQSIPETTAPGTGAAYKLHVNAENVSAVRETKSATGPSNDQSQGWEEILKSIEADYTLNAQQRVAFRITAKRFQQILEGNSDEKKETLRMAMTGPGGTGKTHVVKALKELMTRFNRAHAIRFLAPTGAAAALIGGQTIHTALGLKITKKGDESSPDNEDNNLHCNINIKRREELRAEWKNVDFLLIDEVSMVSAELLCEVDAVLRYVMENDEWFGGINIIFSGDFYQHQPVKARALFVPVRGSKGSGRSTITAKQRQGRIAWKQVKTVVELVEQKRMAADPEFARAVLHVRERCCDNDDLDLLNSLLVKSSDNPHGVDLGDPEWNAATVIVGRNATRMVLNHDKAEAITRPQGSPEMLTCVAKHMEGKRQVAEHSHAHFMQDTKADLPAILNLYIGAPVILREKNLCQDLGITNGAQGILRRIQLEPLYPGATATSAVLALVEFPESDVQLRGLPKGYYPIEPLSCASTQVVRHCETKALSTITAQRWQLPIQLAFAITGHGAQGRTLRKVVSDISCGGNNAYVAASRAQSRHGLAITKSIISVAQLNTPLSFDLVQELKRLDALAHNTLVEHSYLDAPLRQVPDAEGDLASLKHVFTGTGAKSDLPKGVKRRYGDEKEDSKAAKKAKHSSAKPPFSQPPPPASTIAVAQPTASQRAVFRPGCRWDSENYSCAYDSCLVPFVYLISEQSDAWHQAFVHHSELGDYLTLQSRRLVTIPHTQIANAMDSLRNTMRDKLFALDATAFKRFGLEYASCEHIWEIVVGNGGGTRMAMWMHCNGCNNQGTEGPIQSELSYLTTLETVNLLREHSGGAPLIRQRATRKTLIGFDDWFSGILFHSMQSMFRRSGGFCNGCDSTATWSMSTNVLTAGPILRFNCEGWVFLNGPRLRLILQPSTGDSPGIVYRLSSIIYFTGDHFTARILTKDCQVWTYDGRTNGGSVKLETNAVKEETELSFLNARNGADSLLLIYVLEL